MIDVLVEYGSGAIPDVTFTHDDWTLILELDTLRSELIFKMILAPN